MPMTLAVLLHLVLIALLLWNFAFKPDEQDKQFVDSPVKARLVTAPETPKKDASSLKKRQQKQKELEEAKKLLEQRKLLEQKKLEEQKQKEIEQQQSEAEKKLQQDKKLAEEKKLQQKKLEDERKAAEQKKLEQQKKAEAEKKRLAEEAEKKRKADVEKKRKAEAERKKKAEAERKRKEAERKRKELEALEESLDDELFEAAKGEVRQTQIMSEVSKIQRAIRAKIIRNWDEPVFEGSCIMRITMGPGGIVLNIEAIDGGLDYCESAETAISRSAPLPSSDDPQVMAELKSLRMTFDPSQKEN
ncbi:cell envelope integrity protein TolA [Kangiella sp. HZ709]|nr:cell envelope integrity protein TolA [Kangiella sp. HZ709]